MNATAITLSDTDLEYPELLELEEQHSDREYSEEEIAQALASQRLTEDQGWYLHTQNISWQIHVR